MDNEELFFQNIELALKNGCPVWEFLEDEAYAPYIDNPRLVTLLKQYQKDKIE